MSSLHDLIYSQSSQTEAHEQEGSPATERDALHAFYKQEEEEIEPPEEEHAQEEKRKKRKRVSLLNQGETESQKEERIFKQRKNTQWQNIRRRWKKRKYDLRNEVDYGGAVQHVAEKVVERPKEPEQQQVLTYVDSSDEEQLGSLLKPPEAAAAVAKPNEVPSHALDFDKMDYWTKGYSAPPERLAFSYGSKAQNEENDDDAPPILLTAASTAETETTKAQESPHRKIRATLLKADRPARPNDPFYFFPFRHATKCPTHGTFFHQRNLMLMAARCCMCSNPGAQDCQLQDRLIKALHHKSNREAHRVRLLQCQARERAIDFETFHQHKWKSRSVAMREFGVGPVFEHLGSPNWVHTSLKQDSVYKMRQTHRRRVIKNLEVKAEGDKSASTTKKRKSLVSPSSSQNSLKDGDMETDQNSLVLPNAQKPSSSQNSLNDDDMETDENSTVLPNAQQPSSSQNSLNDGDMETDENSTVLPEAEQESDDEFLDDTSQAGVVYQDEICIPATSEYSHVPGTNPPVPNFPLDEYNFVFGPADKNAWTHHASDVDPTVYALTISVLLSRLAVAHHNKIGIRKAQDHIKAYLERTVKTISPITLENTKMLWMTTHDLPIVSLYMAVMGYCSYIANGGALLDPEKADSTLPYSDFIDPFNPDDISDDEDASSNDGKVATADVLARLIYDQCEGFVADKRLAAFPAVNLTVGIARIVMNLPPMAAEIVCRSCDVNGDRTPFELMRSALELMEQKNLLVDANILFSEGEAVNVGQLEHTLHLSCEVFSRCLEADDAEVTHHEWYIAALASSLLLCSGNAIGSGARCRPSSKAEESGYQMLLSQDSSSFTQEKRQKMEKFEEVRKLLADAILALIELTKRPQNREASRPHLALSSLLEWSEVVALIIGPPGRKAHAKSLVKTSCQQARRLHAYHSVQWAIRENSRLCLRRIDDLFCRNEVTVDAPAAVAAGILENDPSDRRHWQRLVRVLGAVGCKVTKTQRRMCRKMKCSGCKRLRKGLNIDHEVLKTRKDVCGWWGEGRRWWDTQILKPPSWILSPDQATADTIFEVSAVVEKRLRDCTELSSNDYSRRDKLLSMELQSPAVGVASTQVVDTNWMRIYTPLNDDESDSETESWRGVHVKAANTPIKKEDGVSDDSVRDTDLPQAASTLSGSSIEAQSYGQLPALVLSDTQRGTELEYLLYKLILTCHVSDVMHPNIANCVWHLAQEYCLKVDSDKPEIDCDEWKCLVWLSLMGLNIPQVLHDAYTARVAEEKKSRRVNYPFSNEEKEAILDGVKHFGRDFVKIQSHSDVLVDKTYNQIRDWYRDELKRRSFAYTGERFNARAELT